MGTPPGAVEAQGWSAAQHSANLTWYLFFFISPFRCSRTFFLLFRNLDDRDKVFFKVGIQYLSRSRGSDRGGRKTSSGVDKVSYDEGGESMRAGSMFGVWCGVDAVMN